MLNLEKLLWTKKSVEKQEKWAIDEKLPRHEEVVNDRKVVYFVGSKNLAKGAPKSEAPDTELYVSRMFGETEDAGNSFIISEAWDEDLRKHMIYAEMIENRSYILGITENNIIDSMKAALETVPKDRIERFVEQAHEAYEADVRFFEKYPKKLDLNLQDLKNTVEYLKDLYNSNF